MSKKWDAYIADLDGKPASFFVDLGLHEEAPIASKPWSLVIRLNLLNPRQDGLTQGDEFEVLNAVEDAVLPALKETDAIYAGRMTTDGRRVMVFYSGKEIDASPFLASVMERFPEYQCE